jgi:hypothetical protein
MVHSESESDQSYLVNLGRWPLGRDARGVMQYNGSCGCGAGIGCKDFMYRCEPNLKKPENKGKVYRCKHIRWARENVLDFLIEHMARNDPNRPEEEQT